MSNVESAIHRPFYSCSFVHSSIRSPIQQIVTTFYVTDTRGYRGDREIKVRHLCRQNHPPVGKTDKVTDSSEALGSELSADPKSAGGWVVWAGTVASGLAQEQGGVALILLPRPLWS